MKEKEYIIDINGRNAISKFSLGFEKIFLNNYSNEYSDIVIVCIGTDRSTGDSLGPLVGHKLKTAHYIDMKVFGTLDNPVHAKNLIDTVNLIYNQCDNPYVISIDACLGKAERVGFISIGTGPLRPGAGVNKDLPEVGDMHVKGIVNVGGFMEYLILQNTRLNLVMKMADIISSGIRLALWKNVYRERASEKLLQ